MEAIHNLIELIVGGPPEKHWRAKGKVLSKEETKHLEAALKWAKVEVKAMRLANQAHQYTPLPLPAPRPPPALEKRAVDVVFYAFGDPQMHPHGFMKGPGSIEEARMKNIMECVALIKAPGELKWGVEAENKLSPPYGTLPDGWAGCAVGEPRGVLIAGDLTHRGVAKPVPVSGTKDKKYNEFEKYCALFGLDGHDGGLPWPVYEGWGNHDNKVQEKDSYDETIHEYRPGALPVLDAIAERNKRRPGVLPDDCAPDRDGHYAWEWDGVFFVNVNLKPSDKVVSSAKGVPKPGPRRALTFLLGWLEKRVGKSGQPVVIMQHYGFDATGCQNKWWDEEEQRHFYHSIAPYNVIAILHGHTHGSSVECLNVTNAGHYKWRPGMIGRCGNDPGLPVDLEEVPIGEEATEKGKEKAEGLVVETVHPSFVPTVRDGDADLPPLDVFCLGTPFWDVMCGRGRFSAFQILGDAEGDGATFVGMGVLHDLGRRIRPAAWVFSKRIRMRV